MKAIIDVDTLLIHAALAAQENYVIVTHTPTGRQKSSLHKLISSDITLRRVVG